MPGAVYEGFNAVEALQESSEAAGWDIEYRQIEQGQLFSATESRQFGDLSLMVESANLRLEIAGSTPDGIVTVLVPGPNTDLLVNDNRLTEERILLLEPGTEMLTLSGQDGKVASMHIPQATFSEYIEHLLPESRGFSIQSGPPVIAGPAVRQLHDALVTAILGDRDSALVNQTESRLLSRLFSLIESGLSQGRCRDDRNHRFDKRRILNRALEYIGGNLNYNVRIPELCAYAGVSQSTLERLFLREYQLSPSAYVRSRRLNAVRRILLRRKAEDTIATVAMNHGFQHLGRFAADYRRQFGVLPSEERQL